MLKSAGHHGSPSRKARSATRLATTLTLLAVFIVPVTAALATPVTNDNFAFAPVISGASGSTSGSTAGFTGEVDEPGNDFVNPLNSAWYRWTAPAGGPVHFNTCGSSYDTYLSVFTGTAVNALTTIVENDDFYDGAFNLQCGYSSSLGFSADSGSTYYIRVDGFQGDTGTFPLTWYRDNDDFADSVPLPGTSGARLGDNVGYTQQTDEPAAHANAEPIESAWYSWTAPANGSVTFNTCNTSGFFDPFLSVFTGAQVDALTLVDFDDNGCGGGTKSTVTVGAPSGATLHIAVDGFGGSEDSFILGWSFVGDLTNDPPTDIALSNNTIDEDQAAGTTVGTLSTTDPDPWDSHTYTLVSGTGDTDNGSFDIVGSTLVTDAVLSFESQETYDILVQSQDTAAQATTKTFTISLNDVTENTAPTDIQLDNASVNENSGSGFFVGNLTTTDADLGDTHAYTLVSGTGSADNGSFQIDGTTLETAADFDYETDNSYTVRIQTDDGLATFAEAFTITVTDVNESPTAAVADLACLSETVAKGSFHLNVGDPEGTALTVTRFSSTPAILPDSGVVITGSGSQRTVTIMGPKKGSAGDATVTFVIDDGVNQSTVQVKVWIGSGSANVIASTFAGTDMMFGLGGDDTMSSIGGDDLLCGASGVDTLDGGDDNDVVDGGKGNDILTGGGGDDVLLGGVNNDTLTGGTGDDVLNGGAGTDNATDFGSGQDTRISVP